MSWPLQLVSCPMVALRRARSLQLAGWAGLACGTEGLAEWSHGWVSGYSSLSEHGGLPDLASGFIITVLIC